MTPYHFLYKVVSLLLLNDNAFVYPLYDKDALEFKTLYQLNSIIVEPIVDKSEAYYLKVYFESGESFILPKEKYLLNGLNLKMNSKMNLKKTKYKKISLN